jgi:hypothetical protein
LPSPFPSPSPFPYFLRDYSQKDWTDFRKSKEHNCTHKWCIHLKKEWCEIHGGKLAKLLAEKRFKGLGSRSDCKCRWEMIKKVRRDGGSGREMVG